MRAIVTKEFRGIGDHDKSERFFAVNEVIYGTLAETAVGAGNAVEDGASAKAAKKPAAKKAKG